ncbi:hypothetical protein PW52_16315 [Tamlana sedimentorum]|uniref:DUF4302 domain-containing protein n=1 Tax=Neotamlana sedimentorum TaxID=1435349 RepID=A0A0D7VZH9_9FLAO|nr:DUF4302 domain-containing protein [Tamlana sedimentorum]KJD31838.1 hypothetical protein PW52_16315 [Tamlana sedimentorum]
MKNILKNNYVLLFIMSILLVACNSDDSNEVFDEAPANRLSQANEELLNILTSNTQGFKASYFTKNDEFGGVTFFMRFNTDGTVDMTSDFDDEIEIASSSYEVRVGTTTELVFTTRNHIQKVSDPLLGGLIGTGFKGTSVFQLFSNEDGELEFKDVRNRDTSSFVLEPTGFTDFETESIEMVEASIEQKNNILPEVTSSVFQVLRMDNANGTVDFNLNYDTLRLFATPTLTLDSGDLEELSFGVIFTDTGLNVNPAIEYEGESYTEFIYDEDSNSFISTVNGTTATILFSDWPAYISNDINEMAQIDGGLPIFLYRPGLGANPLTSAGHDNIIESLDAFLAQFGLSFFDYIFYFDFDDNGNVCEGFLSVRINGLPSLNYCFSGATINDDRTFTMSFQGAANQDSFDLQFLAQDIINFFDSSEGMVGELEGSFQSDTFSYINLAATFASLEDPSLRVYGLFF